MSDAQIGFEWCPPPRAPEPPAPEPSRYDDVRISRTTRVIARLCGIDPSDDAAVRRWHVAASRRLTEALERLHADENPGEVR